MAIQTTASIQTANEDTQAADKSAAGPSFFSPRISGKDIIYFSSQLSLMLEVGTSLTDAVVALESQTANPTLRAVMRDVQHDIEEGQSFSAALSRHPKVFDGVYVSMIRAGETGGYMRDALERIVEMREKREALIAQVRAALTYPMILSLVAGVVVVFVLTGVLPKFMPLFAGKEYALPGSTKVLMALSLSLTQFWYIWAVSIAGIFFAIPALLHTPPGKWFKDYVGVSLPIVGPLTNKILTGQLLRTMGHLLESQVALIDALGVTRMTLPNVYYKRLVDRVKDVVESGGRLSQAFQDFAYMPPTVRQMIATAEEAGNLYPVMLRLAQHYDNEIEQQLKKAASLIEPLALVVLGGIVGVIVASVILPLFKLAHAVG